MGSILFVDGQNFKGQIERVFVDSGKQKPVWKNYDFAGLLNHVLQGLVVDRKIFYAAKIQAHPQTQKKSQQLIQDQRELKTHLEAQGFEFIISGHVRGHLEKGRFGKDILVFKEKGVDVKIAVDLVTMSCDNKITSAIIASSDSDLQPAIKELSQRNIERIYVGFEIEPNKGLSFTTNRTILIRNAEVLSFEKVVTLPLPAMKGSPEN